MAPTTRLLSRRPWPGGLVGVLVGLLLAALIAWYGVVLGVQALTAGRPAAATSRFVPADGSREQVTFRQHETTTTAMVENARFDGGTIAYAMSSQAMVYLEAPAEGLAAASWWREAVVSGDLQQPARYRIRSLSSAGIWLREQDWDQRGLSFEHLLELPTEVAAGQTWSSSGRALGRPTDRQLSYRNTSSAAVPADTERARQGCLQISSTTDLTSAAGVQQMQEDNLWCPGVGMVENRGAFGDRYAVLPLAGPYASIPAASLQPAAWDQRDLEQWTVRRESLINGDASFGAADAILTAGVTPVVTANGVVVFPLAGGSDLTALIPQTRGGLWWHWWARPQGDVVSMAAAGSVVLVTTTERQLLAYTAGGRFRWGVQLDDVSVVPPLVLSGDRVAVGTVGGAVSVFDLESGTRRWTGQLDHGVHSPLVASADVLFTADAGPSTTAWDLASGEQLWTIDEGSAFGTTLLADQDRLVIVGDGLVLAYQARTGNRVWAHRVGLEMGSVTRLDAALLVQIGENTEAWSMATGRTSWSLADAQPAVQPGGSCSTGAGPDLGLFFRGDRLLAARPDGTVRQEWAVSGAAPKARSVSCAAGGIWLISNDPAQQLQIETIGNR